MQISCRRHDKVTIFDLPGDVDFANSRQLRKSVLKEIDENRTSHVMVNLSAVRYIDSFRYSFPGGGIESVTRLRGTRCILFGLSTLGWEVLQLSRLIKVFEIYGKETGSRFDGHCGCVHRESRSNHRKPVTQAQRRRYDFKWNDTNMSYSYLTKREDALGVFVPIPMPYTQVQPVAWRNSDTFLTASGVIA